MATLDRIDLCWEGSEFDPANPPDRHRLLVGSTDEREAIYSVREAVAPYGTFGDFHAVAVRDLAGAIMRTPIRRWADIDWEAVQRKAPLSELQRGILGALFNDHEPTSIIADEPDVLGDRESVTTALRDLETHSLVRCAWNEPAETGREQWWALTDECWDLLGLIKSPRYG
jgi:hypothetical protein